MSTPNGPGAAVRELTYGEAVREAIAEEMRRDPTVFIIGEDVAEAGHPFKVLLGLVQEFGTSGSSTRRSPSRGTRASAWARR